MRISDWSSDVCSSDLLGLYANLRPVRPHASVLGASPIKQHLLHGVDMIVVRELTGGIYFGDKQRHADSASDLCAYSVAEIERIVRSACRLARQRRGHVVSVDKANALETSRLCGEGRSERRRGGERCVR